ncbi:formyltetrahydrofolate deformylase [Spelaeicoccus albus]|uniref:Formyltetrahydrofolate deformylase n=1 Tax=Spelaeicoccus albus TaxID=1280376 RepID=A0A7Z0D5N6_9MICO|nr:formyltetrahydrofolate deformylase [Spelaeicoccus albus]NYI69294.1 formyltetrahydrofolate deformylase [Spelaeicoccus albus]
MNSPDRMQHQRVLRISCPDRPGIVHAVTGVLAGAGANITESQQFGNADSEHFFLRLQFSGGPSSEDLARALRQVEAEFGMDVALDTVGRPVRTIIMVSKAGHCLNDLLYRQGAGQLPIEVAAVVGNHPDLAPLAEFYGVDFVHVPVTEGTKAEAERRITGLVESLNVELVVLARYMQILSPELCRRLHGRVINIHHSFLPSFKGAKPYHQAHARGVKLIGATAHYVTPDLDEGPIIEQDVARVTHQFRTSDLVSLGQEIEARTLSHAVRWHAEGRVLLDGDRTVVFR